MTKLLRQEDVKELGFNYVSDFKGDYWEHENGIKLYIDLYGIIFYYKFAYSKHIQIRTKEHLEMLLAVIHYETD